MILSIKKILFLNCLILFSIGSFSQSIIEGRLGDSSSAVVDRHYVDVYKLTTDKESMLLTTVIKSRFYTNFVIVCPEERLQRSSRGGRIVTVELTKNNAYFLLVSSDRIKIIGDYIVMFNADIELERIINPSSSLLGRLHIPARNVGTSSGPPTGSKRPNTSSRIPPFKWPPPRASSRKRIPLDKL